MGIKFRALKSRDDFYSRVLKTLAKNANLSTNKIYTFSRLNVLNFRRRLSVGRSPGWEKFRPSAVDTGKL